MITRPSLHRQNDLSPKAMQNVRQSFRLTFESFVFNLKLKLSEFFKTCLIIAEKKGYAQKCSYIVTNNFILSVYESWITLFRRRPETPQIF